MYLLTAFRSAPLNIIPFQNVLDSFVIRCAPHVIINHLIHLLTNFWHAPLMIIPQKVHIHCEMKAITGTLF
jgi:hypothetical protein